MRGFYRIFGDADHAANGSKEMYCSYKKSFGRSK